MNWLVCEDEIWILNCYPTIMRAFQCSW